ncbi:MAG: DUF2157 domain-containing protein [Deltaproteobacteria bacterium]|nr:DUF2157 domain-containing protein [Deltaproteobacteria bacterium]
MMSFLRRLETLLVNATDQGILSVEAKQNLVAFAREGEKKKGILHLTSVFGWLGGFAAIAGIILLVASNWDSIGGWVKIGGFLILLGGTHVTALWIHKTEKPYPKTAEALHFIGAGLVIAGVGLISQIYNIDSKPPNGVLLWFIAIAPFVWLLRSGPMAVMTLFAFVLWVHMEGGFAGSPLQLPESFTFHLILEIGFGIALLGFAEFLKTWGETVSRVFQWAGGLFLLYGIYVLGFFRHFSEMSLSGHLILPIVSLLPGFLGAVMGWRHFSLGSPRLRNYLGILFGLIIGIAVMALALDRGFLPRGPVVEFFQFGWTQKYDLSAWLLSVAAWILWFFLALWCISYGTHSGKRFFLNLGVIAFGLGIITRFFDLIGTMTQTGTLFLLGGVVLLGTGWAMEKWRRNIIVRMGGIGH